MSMEDKEFLNHSGLLIRPTLFIGCGGRGTEAVVRARDLVLQEVFSGNKMDLNDFSPLKFLSMDSAKQNIEADNSAHDLDTIAIACKHDKFCDIINSDGGIKGQMPRRNYERMLKGLPNTAMGNSTCPPLGAMNFLGAWDDIKAGLRAVLENWKQEKPGPGDVDSRSFMESAQVLVAASLYGGTGSGIHTHLAAMLRVLFKELEITNVGIYSFFLLPDVVKANASGKRKLHANAYAALKELDYFMQGNEYRMRVGASGDEVVVSNDKVNDVLFNKVFLVNDENNNGVKLNEFESVEMIGEMLFHMGVSELGDALHRHLVDSAHENCNSFAPEPAEDGTVSPEVRPRSYSVFGLATTRIPYRTLKHNMIVDHAMDVLNECLLKPDLDENAEGQAKLDKRDRYLRERYLENTLPQSHVDLAQEQVDKALEEFIVLPSFMRVKGSNIDGYMNANKCKLNEATSGIASEVKRIMDEWAVLTGQVSASGEDKAENVKDILQARYMAKIAKFKDHLLSEDGAGTELTLRILKEVKKQLDASLTELIALSAGMDKLDDHASGIRKASSALKNVQAGSAFRLLGNGKSIRSANRIFKELIGRISGYHKALMLEEKIGLYQWAVGYLEMTLVEIDQNFDKFNVILSELQSMSRPYQSSKLLLNAVSESLLQRFISNYSFPAGARAEDVAKGILGEDGFELDVGENIQLSEFTDYSPREIARALFENSKRIINENVDESVWTSSFCESGLFPKSGTEVDWAAQGVDVKAYSDMMSKLINNSSPYLEYRENGFSMYDENYFIYPREKCGGESEKVRLDQHDTTKGRTSWQTSRSEVGAYSVTCLQFHFGIPLYSIDKFEEWKQDYDYMMKNTDRPLHKFDDFTMKEPYITLETLDIDEADLRDLFYWAVDISKKGYSVFTVINEIPILDCMGEESVKAFYYDMYDKRYVPVSRFSGCLGSVSGLDMFTMNKLRVVLSSLDKPVDQSLVNNFLLTGSNDPAAVIDFVRKLYSIAADELQEHDEVQVRDDGADLEIWMRIDELNAASHYRSFGHLFRTLKAVPEFRSTITSDQVLKHILDNETMRFIFWNKCREAHEFLVSMGMNDELHSHFSRK